jgi:hypothetical protein
MSQGVFGWRLKATGLGLLLSLVVLSGATCFPPGLGLDGSTNSGTPAAQTPPPVTLTVLSPLSDLNIQAGTVVQISWDIFSNGQGGQLQVFYDTDANFGNGVRVLTLIDIASPTAPDRYTWNTTGLANGIYYAGAQLTVGTTSVVSYAIGRVIVTGSVPTQQYSLDQLGTTIKGCIFEGFSFAGRLGTVMQGRFDMFSGVANAAGVAVPDGISDFILVAPVADSHYIEDPEVGEAYLMPGWDSRSGVRATGWYEGAHYSVNAVGTDPDLPGTIIVGPAYISATDGITAVLPIQDVDADGGAELMIGTPRLINGRWEDQDYDPCDDGAPYAEAPFAWPVVADPCTPDNHDLIGSCPHGGLIWSSGYITVLASTTPNLYNPLTRLGGVVHMDEIGELADDRPVRGRNIDPGVGVRVYPYARLGLYYDFLQNDYRFGQALGTEDVDGDGVADWLMAEPRALNGAGDINIAYSGLARTEGGLWTSPLPASANAYSWPYFVGFCPGTRIPVWPFGMIDFILGDELKAPDGQLSNPIGMGDFNDDGPGDVGCAAPNYSAGGLKPQCGSAYMVFGRAPFGDHSVSEIKDPVVLDALPGIWIEGMVAGDQVGYTMTSLGRPNWGMPGHPKLRDFNGDDRQEWVIGAPGRDVPGKNDVGAIAIIWGNSRLDGHFTWDQITTGEVPGVIITGANQGDRFAEYMVEAGDINGDGSDDLIVAAPGAENPLTGAQDTGAIYIIYGPPTGGAGLGKYQALSGTYSIADLMNSGDVKVRAFYGASQGHRIGPVAGAGDIDNDGFEDILIADPVAAPLGRTDAGEVMLVFGSQY